MTLDNHSFGKSISMGQVPNSYSVQNNPKKPKMTQNETKQPKTSQNNLRGELK